MSPWLELLKAQALCQLNSRQTFQIISSIGFLSGQKTPAPKATTASSTSHRLDLPLAKEGNLLDNITPPPPLPPLTGWAPRRHPARKCLAAVPCTRTRAPQPWPSPLRPGSGSEPGEEINECASATNWRGCGTPSISAEQRELRVNSSRSDQFLRRKTLANVAGNRLFEG